MILFGFFRRYQMKHADTFSRLFKHLFAILWCFLATILISGCNESSTSADKATDLVPSNYSQINVAFVGYDEVRITHQAGIDLTSDEITEIAIGIKDVTVFRPLLQYQSTYNPDKQVYEIHFDFTLKLDNTLTTVPLTVRYFFRDDYHFDADTIIALYKFPYPSAEIFATRDLIHPDMYQEIALTNSKFLFHGWNSDGLHVYDLKSKQKTDYNFYRGGSHLTAYKNYVFCDIDHKNIVRFNLNTQSVDFTLPGLTDVASIDGMAIQDSTLFVLVVGWSEYYLKTFTIDGAEIDSMAYPHGAYFMAIADSIVYKKHYVNDSYGIYLSRFDLRSKSFLPDVYSPASELKGLEIVNDTLYYCDFRKGFVGKIALSDLVPVE
jgi:hypothetical protein